MSEQAQFSRGDRVIHPRRPEWGQGVVDHATAIVHDGRAAQRLVVVFANYGRITLNTAIAALRPNGNGGGVAQAELPAPAPGFTTLSAGESAATGAADTGASSIGRRSGGAGMRSGGGGWLSTLTRTNVKVELWRLPIELTDPFASLASRLAATLETYRYSGDPRDPASQRGLLEWAMRQTGLHDPLSKYTRHELEQAFPRFARDRDNHLLDLVRTLKREGRMDVIDQARQNVPTPAARAALDRTARA